MKFKKTTGGCLIIDLQGILPTSNDYSDTDPNLYTNTKQYKDAMIKVCDKIAENYKKGNKPIIFMNPPLLKGKISENRLTPVLAPQENYTSEQASTSYVLEMIDELKYNIHIYVYTTDTYVNGTRNFICSRLSYSNDDDVYEIAAM